jgi:hypothetical protein
MYMYMLIKCHVILYIYSCMDYICCGAAFFCIYRIWTMTIYVCVHDVNFVNDYAIFVYEIGTYLCWVAHVIVSTT